jgi:hypothetical protein
MAPSDSLTYRVVFDVSRQLPQDWWGFILPLVMVTVLMRFGPRNRVNQTLWFKGVFVGFAIFLTIAIAVITWTSYFLFRGTLEHGDYRVVEGTVAEFVPEKPNTKQPESFIVVSPAETTVYSYSRWIGTGGLNNSHGHIRNGVRVRIADVRGRIARLEVANEPAPK